MSTHTAKPETAKSQASASDPINGQAADVRSASHTPAERAKVAVAETVETAREKLREVKGGVGETLHSVSSSAQRTSEEVRKRAAEARETARQQFEATSRQLQEGYGRARLDAADLVEDAGEYIRENPGKAVLIAAVAGFALGLLFRERGEA